MVFMISIALICFTSDAIVKWCIKNHNPHVYPCDDDGDGDDDDDDDNDDDDDDDDGVIPHTFQIYSLLLDLFLITSVTPVTQPFSAVSILSTLLSHDATPWYTDADDDGSAFDTTDSTDISDEIFSIDRLCLLSSTMNQ